MQSMLRCGVFTFAVVYRLAATHRDVVVCETS